MGSIAEARRRIIDAAEEALAISGFDLAGRAVERAPIGTGVGTGSPSEDPGRLRASARVGSRPYIPGEGVAGGEGVVERLGDTLSVEVSFDTPYAAAQHEGHAVMTRGGKSYTWRAKRWSEPGTGPKYLEGPLLEMAPRYLRALAENVRRATVA